MQGVLGLVALSLLAILCASGTNAESSFTTVVTFDATLGTATFVATQESLSRWMAIAIGTGMSNADHAYVCAKNDGVYSLRRVSLNPYPSDPWGTFPEAVSGSCGVVDNKLKMEFTRPLTGNSTGMDQKELKTGGEMTDAIYSEGNSGFSYHDKRGVLSINIVEGTAVAGAIRYSTLIILHMVIMGAAWVVLAPVGIICARYFKSKSPMWFNLHRMFVLLAIVFTIVGVAIGFTQGSQRTTHYKLGIAISAVLMFQPLLGIIRPDKESDKRKMWYIAHAILGFILIALTIAQVHQGIVILDTAASKVAVPVVISLYGTQALFILISEGGLHGLYSLPWVKKDADHNRLI